MHSITKRGRLSETYCSFSLVVHRLVAFLQALFRRSQLKAVMDIHGTEYGLGGDLSEDEITVIRGALDLSHKTATSCMTPLDKVMCCSHGV